MAPTPSIPRDPERARVERLRPNSFELSGSVFLIAGDGKIVKLPIPSENPHDPLNWSWRKRGLSLLSAGLFAYIGTVLTQGASLALKGLEASFPLKQMFPFTIETLVTAPTVLMGLGAFLWIPLTFALGRRPVFIIAAFLQVAAALGASASKSYYELLACVSLLGFADGFGLSVLFLIVIDVTFIHQRPRAIAAVWSTVGGYGVISLSCVPPLTNHGTQWRRFYIYWSIPAAITFVMALLVFPETYFKRPTVAYNGLTIQQTASERIIIYEDDNINQSDDWSNKGLPHTPSRSWIRAFVDQYFFSRSTTTSWMSMLYCYPQIFFCSLNPLIFWVVIMTAVNFAGMMFIGATFPIILTSPPYSLKSSIVMVSNSAGIGGLLAWPSVEFLSCFVLKNLARRNKGIREAEHYLVCYILPVVTGSLSTLIYGLAVSRQWSFPIYCIAYGFNGFSFASLAIANTLWVTEAFPRWAAPALVVVGGGSYVASFLISLALVPWIATQGYLIVGIELAGLQIVSGLILTPIAFWGKDLRQKIHGRWAERRDGALRPL
ncbi:MFS general substrate transporter [Lindgomyces ingoldianus]|uniref:MFS general substrate transporter n=1 Tax=Lindgomyces ingoldianus TaxID=673940 RepID=A0ACB6QXM0_9PLEO|nr:MFS general substrate transporter [Lindgomyces ingoldianus]KAF2470825.1 MFS general substrate transporter [Lindgomyces ingoldianus]